MNNSPRPQNSKLVESLAPTVRKLERFAKLQPSNKPDHFVEHRENAFVLVDELRRVRQNTASHNSAQGINTASQRDGVNRALANLVNDIADLPRLEAVELLERTINHGIALPSGQRVFANYRLYSALVSTADSMLAAKGPLPTSDPHSLPAATDSQSSRTRITLKPRSGGLQISLRGKSGIIHRQMETRLLLCLYDAYEAKQSMSPRKQFEQIWDNKLCERRYEHEIAPALKKLKSRLMTTLEACLGPCPNGKWIEAQPGMAYYLNPVNIVWRMDASTWDDDQPRTTSFRDDLTRADKDDNQDDEE